MTEQFYTILTNIGKAKIANASALGNIVNFSQLALGDSNGSYYNPTEDQTNIVNEVWRGQIGSVTIDPQNSNWIVLETVIPSDQGGFMVREVGVFDTEGNMLAVGKYPETYKPLAVEGSAKDLRVRIILEVSNTDVVNLEVDPSIILATKDDIDVVNNNVSDLAGEGRMTETVKQNAEEIGRVSSQMAELTDEIATHKAEKAHYPVRQPTSFQGSPDDVAVNLSWTNPDDLMVKDINNNDIILAEFKEVEIKRDGSIIYTGTAENFTDTGLTNYQEYTYEIISVTTGRVRSEPATANVTPVPYTMDYAVGVSNFKVVGATESGGQAQISWTDPTDTSFAGVLIRRSETTYPATINEGVEVYNGTGESVTDTGLVNEQTYFYTIWAYSTKNAYSDDTNKQAGLAEVMQGQDGSGSPGSAVLIEGDMEEGFFGEVSANQFITGDSLASLVGISAGTSQFSDGGWLKFAWKGNVQFIAKKPIRNSISWDAINAAKCVYGDSGDKTVEIGGLTYKVRLMRALEQSNDPKATASANAGTVNHYSEWNRLMCQIHEQAISKSWDYPDNIENDIDILEHNLGNGTQGMYNDDDVVVKSGDGRYSWCQEMGTSTSNRLIRGHNGVSYSGNSASYYTTSYCGWRPVLELVP